MRMDPLERIVAVCLTIIALAAMAGGYHACDRQERNAHTLRRIYVEKCRGTPQEAERRYQNGHGT